MDENTAIEFKTTGSALLNPLSDLVGVPLDQVNFIVCQVFGLAAAVWFRLYLTPQFTTPEVRHAVAALLGASFITFCFGWYAVHVFILVLACYGIILKASIHNVHRYTMVVSIGYLTICQVSRVIIFNYGILSTDFSGPLMIITQKITLLAFQVHDGMCQKQEKLTEDQRRLAVHSKPSLLKYLSYNINFLSILVGPCSNYKDYLEFIEGHHIQSTLRSVKDASSQQNGWDKMPEPSPVKTVINKLLVCVGCLLWFFIITKAFPIAYNVDPQFISEASFITRLGYAFISIQAARPKFYFAWTLAEAIHNAAGYGISGMDENGKVSWDLLSNVYIWKIETATSLKSFIDSWNIQTALWLKRVCYDRAPYYAVPLTFVLSAIWHGVYPGYYFTFISAVPITFAARAVRRNFRQYFLSSRQLKLCYDVVTWAATQLTICYIVMPFLLLAVEPTVMYYRSMYFHVHIISILAMILLPSKPWDSKTQSHAQQSHNNLKVD
ncbi:lysophospholipid acyltransferase 1 isoform X1 [Triplophysa dalaica]|uniref:lysophospholipid acyltransferase 1 isoform X1 n=1 Tax=Triplophysa dalaica TaxID=1582913 RepID=UPI0024DF661C|nr:lysophospholipid acyltransferase 1 isoform X1 [Triplophysa dalaica]